MLSNQLDFLDLLRIVKRRKKPALIFAGVVFLIGLVTALLMPPTYVSSSTILIEQQEIPQDLVRSTVTSFADQRIQSITQRTMTFSNLVELIKKYDLYADDRKSEPMEVIIDEMRSDIKTKIISADVVDPRSGRPVEATIALSIKYHSENPETARKVASEITSLFLNENLKNRKEMANLTEEFIGKSLDEEKKKLDQLSSRLADFKQKNSKELPEYTQFNYSLVDRLEGEIRERKSKVDALQERRVFLKGELARLGASRIVTGGDLNSLTPEDRLQYLYNLSLQFKTQYEPSHPDVIRTNNAINELLASGVELRDVSFLRDVKTRLMAELEILEGKYSATHPDVIKLKDQLKKIEAQDHTRSIAPHRNDKSNNPDYIQLASQLQAVEQNIVAELEVLNGLQDKRTSLDASLSRSPKVEQEYRDLLRELESANRNFLEYQAKQTQAKLAMQLEHEQKGERFTLIEPPLLPEEPISPNRVLLIGLSILFALAASILCILVLEKTDKTIRSESGLEKLCGFAPLVVIPHLYSGEQTVKRIPIAPFVYAVLIGLLIVLCIHFFYKPLDVIYYILVRKFLI